MIGASECGGNTANCQASAEGGKGERGLEWRDEGKTATGDNKKLVSNIAPKRANEIKSKG